MHFEKYEQRQQQQQRQHQPNSISNNKKQWLLCWLVLSLTHKSLEQRGKWPHKKTTLYNCTAQQLQADKLVAGHFE
jgi:hypothetical protein